MSDQGYGDGALWPDDLGESAKIRAAMSSADKDFRSKNAARRELYCLIDLLGAGIVTPNQCKRGLFVIYVLKDDSEQAVRYVGKTTARDYEYRMKAHRTVSLRRRRTKKERWICSVIESGGAIASRIVNVASSDAEAAAAERDLIAFYRSVGEPLTNLTDGGEGTSGSKYRLTAETRLRQSIAARKRPPKSPEHRSRIAETLRGRRLSPEHKAKVLAGLPAALKASRCTPWTPERRARLSLAIKTSARCVAVREKIAEDRRGKPRTIESRLKQSATAKKSPRVAAMIERLAALNKGKPISEERRRKTAAGVKAAWARRMGIS